MFWERKLVPKALFIHDYLIIHYQYAITILISFKKRLTKYDFHIFKKTPHCVEREHSLCNIDGNF